MSDPRVSAMSPESLITAQATLISITDREHTLFLAEFSSTPHKSNRIYARALWWQLAVGTKSSVKENHS